MFSGIARRYDLLNHVLSMNIDKRWRRKLRLELADVLADQNAIVLDVACGTGDLSIELKSGAKAAVIGADFCRPMLEVASTKTDTVPFVEGDAMQMSFADGSFDAVTIAFGLRNLANVENGLRELHRIVKPGGKLIVLEFSSPIIPGFRGLFNFYFSNILPRIGGLVSGNRSAYEYLPESVSKFPDQKTLASMLGDVGFEQVQYENLTGGIAAIHTGVCR
ncbi:MAG: bifunctional demethylmenaquinone methyltransferase/2-methoxy-6-polyprenyl-1,4-benzoquinol methylase UbiE [Blastocatellia bacterium]|nr:bifunctional demethylmenaquinone methyltransferase/2-methoxy-6-polyprenyl-1,4-benzoquinol methylase UbiE [Blastocatellia bacterium]